MCLSCYDSVSAECRKNTWPQHTLAPGCRYRKELPGHAPSVYTENSTWALTAARPGTTRTGKTAPQPLNATTTYQDELLHGRSTKAQQLAQVEGVPCTVADLSASWRYAPGAYLF